MADNTNNNFIKEWLTQLETGFRECLSGASAASFLVSKTKDAVRELKEIDTLLTEISRVDSSLSKSDLTRMTEDAFAAADKYGQKAEDYLSAFLEASRAGYDNAAGIAELSTAVQSAGGVTAELAGEMISAADKAYRLNGSVSDLTRVLDGMHAIAGRNSVTMSGLSEGMTAVSSTAASFGVSADETAAALGTMMAATRQSGAEAADAFRTILLYLGQVTDTDAGIDAAGLARYEDACNALNVSLRETRDSAAALRDPMEVLRDLSVQYNKLSSSDSRKSALLDSLGDSASAAQLDALLGRWSSYESMIQQYQHGAGSMAAEAEKTASSWEGSLNRLSNTWTDTVENIADSGAITGAINGLNGLLSVINTVTEKLGAVGSIGLGAGLFAGMKNVGMT